MASTPENKVKKWLKYAMNNRYPEAWCYAPPGGPFGQIGVSDFIWVIPAGLFNVVCVIEVKSDKFMIPTVPQVTYLKKMLARGAVAVLMRGKDQDRLDKVFQILDQRIKLLETFSKNFENLDPETLDKVESITVKNKELLCL